MHSRPVNPYNEKNAYPAANACYLTRQELHWEPEKLSWRRVLSLKLAVINFFWQISYVSEGSFSNILPPTCLAS